MAAPAADGDDRVMAAAQSIVKSLGTNNADTKDMILILSNFDNRLSSITNLISAAPPAADPLIEAAEQVLLRWDPPSPRGPPLPLPWDDSPDEAAEYLAAVDELIAFLFSDESPAPAAEVDRAESLLQLAMARLEDELRLLLVRSTVPLESQRLYDSIRRPSASVVPAGYDFSADAAADGGETPKFTGKHSRARSSSASLSLSVDLGGVDLVRPESVADLREIADRMLKAGYEKECCQTYSAVRREALDECLAVLGVDRLGIDEVQKIDWHALDEKMRKWVPALKIVVRVLIAGEWRLCDQIFGGSRPIAEICFAETAKGCLMQVLTFADAISVGHRSPEKLFRILDMYEALNNLIPELQELFSNDENSSGGPVCSEARSIISGLGMAAKGTFAEFENAVKKETSRKPTAGGEIHPLVRYVMNYVKLVVDYSATLNSILDAPPPGADVIAEDDDDAHDLNEMSRVGGRLLILMNSLESNILEKSKHYDDSGIQYVFLMNNLLYIVNKVRDSELGTVLGDSWVRKRRGQVRQYATSYLRASWSKVLGFLKDEGLSGGIGSSSVSNKAALKERFKNFNVGLEEIVRTQATWKVPDPRFREELRLSVSDHVIPAYRFFRGRFGYQLDTGRNAKYIKYTPEDLEVLLQELFEGSAAPLNHPRRKLST